MKPSLAPGLCFRWSHVVGEGKLVPALYPESPEFLEMPEVLATGFLVGFLEWACIMAIKPHLDWPREQSLGIQIAVTHEAPTVAGMTITATVTLTEVAGRQLSFAVEAHDGVDMISRGTHQRMVIDREKFLQKLERKTRGP